ncbi:hypothetical protein [Streptomyces gibsoniae]|uniref:Uncharacterized protein n=1 Tax=Streptomyces gibsoniae TaxID=3075529 RepID=A0ABU2U7T8_9ACTN|nr:hypothetical protein [Streptomyces sp. DSM 41699]MDT0469283.1 hypothetical protein [Streptomyces sp. DSM 41699]
MVKERTLRRCRKREFQALDRQPPLQAAALCRALGESQGRHQPRWADDLAHQLYAALHSEQPHEASTQVVAVVMPPTQSLEDDVRQLGELSDAVGRRILAGAKQTDRESETP